jgi:hypothetical protein
MKSILNDRFRVVILLLVFFAFLPGCGGGGGGGSTVLPGNTTIPTTSTTSEGNIELPTGTSLTASSLKVISPEEETSLANDGTYKVTTQNTSSSPKVNMILDSSDNPVLIGYELPGTTFSSARLRSFAPAPGRAASAPVVNIRTTALALCMINPLLMYTSNAQKQQVAEKILTMSDFTALVALVETKFKANPATLLDGDVNGDMYEKAVLVTANALKALASSAPSLARPLHSIFAGDGFGIKESKVATDGTFTVENWKASPVVMDVWKKQSDNTYKRLTTQTRTVEARGGILSRWIGVKTSLWPPSKWWSDLKIAWPTAATTKIEKLYSEDFTNDSYMMVLYDKMYQFDGTDRFDTGTVYMEAAGWNAVIVSIDVLSLYLDVKNFATSDNVKTIMKQLLDPSSNFGVILSLVKTSIEKMASHFRAGKPMLVAADLWDMVFNAKIYKKCLEITTATVSTAIADKFASKITNTVVKSVLKKIGPGLIVLGHDIANVFFFVKDWILSPHMAVYYVNEGNISLSDKTPVRLIVQEEAVSRKGGDVIDLTKFKVLLEYADRTTLDVTSDPATKWQPSLNSGNNSYTVLDPVTNLQGEDFLDDESNDRPDELQKVLVQYTVNNTTVTGYLDVYVYASSYQFTNQLKTLTDITIFNNDGFLPGKTYDLSAKLTLSGTMSDETKEDLSWANATIAIIDGQGTVSGTSLTTPTSEAELLLQLTYNDTTNSYFMYHLFNIHVIDTKILQSISSLFRRIDVGAGQNYDLSQLPMAAVVLRGSDTESIQLTSSSGIAWTVKSGNGSISGSTYTAGNSGPDILTATYTMDGITKTVDVEVTVKPVLSSLALSSSSGTVYKGSTFDLSSITVTATMSDASNSAVTGIWTAGTNEGTISGTTYTPPDTLDTYNLTVSYTDSSTPPVTKTATFAMTVANPPLASISISPSEMILQSSYAYDVSNVVVTAKYANDSTQTITTGLTWSKTEGEGTLSGTSYSSSVDYSAAVLQVSYTEGQTTSTALFNIGVIDSSEPTGGTYDPTDSSNQNTSYVFRSFVKNCTWKYTSWSNSNGDSYVGNWYTGDPMNQVRKGTLVVYKEKFYWYPKPRVIAFAWNSAHVSDVMINAAWPVSGVVDPVNGSFSNVSAITSKDVVIKRDASDTNTVPTNHTWYCYGTFDKDGNILSCTLNITTTHTYTSGGEIKQYLRTYFY